MVSVFRGVIFLRQKKKIQSRPYDNLLGLSIEGTDLFRSQPTTTRAALSLHRLPLNFSVFIADQRIYHSECDAKYLRHDFIKCTDSH